MKVQDAIKTLTALSNALKKSGIDEIEQISRVPASSVGEVDVPKALSMLVALSSFDKAQWINIIEEYRFPIDVRPRDASRDIMGKLLKHLESDPLARKKLANTSRSQNSDTSPELTRALELLLKS